ncbi:MAG: DUF262 domain-containing protein [Leadbetterella sp.]|nr:DUF262 domain-containing protein [Leadbetterella sp.]
MENSFVGLFNIKEIFDGKIFRIPDYQRGYSWKEDHINAIWEDLMNLSETNSQIH